MKNVFYLKVNRYEGYTIRNIYKWIKVIACYDYVDTCAYIICDDEKLKKWIDEVVDFEGVHYEYICSTDDERILQFTDKYIGRIPGAAIAHLTTFVHAQEHHFDYFWNIDADDTRFCLSPQRNAELLQEVERYQKDNGIKLFSLDMWTTRSRKEHVWSFGITYVDNSINWLDIICDFGNNRLSPPKHMCSIDGWIRHIKKNSDINIQGYYFENLRFIHYTNDFFFRANLGEFVHWKNGYMDMPILSACFGLENTKAIPIAEELIKLDIGITDFETTKDMVMSSIDPVALMQLDDSIM